MSACVRCVRLALLRCRGGGGSGGIRGRGWAFINHAQWQPRRRRPRRRRQRAVALRKAGRKKDRLKRGRACEQTVLPSKLYDVPLLYGHGHTYGIPYIKHMQRKIAACICKLGTLVLLLRRLVTLYTKPDEDTKINTVETAYRVNVCPRRS